MQLFALVLVSPFKRSFQLSAALEASVKCGLCQHLYEASCVLCFRFCMKPLNDMRDDLDDDSDGVSTTTSISESHEGSIGITEGGAYHGREAVSDSLGRLAAANQRTAS